MEGIDAATAIFPQSVIFLVLSIIVEFSMHIKFIRRACKAAEAVRRVKRQTRQLPFPKVHDQSIIDVYHRCQMADGRSTTVLRDTASNCTTRTTILYPLVYETENLD